MRSLIIVDPQYDFITGTLPVAGAEQAMNRLAELLPQMEVDEIIVTMDAHPMNHMSYHEQGGEWPMHCAKYSQGAAIWDPLFQALKGRKVTFIEKGTEQAKEEYSAFEKSYPKLLDERDEIWLCGIAGNVCVLNSLRDLVQHGLGVKIEVIESLSPSLDDGSALRAMVAECGVRFSTAY